MVNVYQNNICVIRYQLATCIVAKTGPIHLLLVGLMQGCKAQGQQMKILWYSYICLNFSNITYNVSILVLNGFLAVITYCTNLVLP